MSPRSDVFHTDDNSKPYTHLNFKNDPDEFQFVVISDNAGGARPGVFAKAMEMANLLQPEFDAHVGDLIEGYNDDKKQIRAWWQEIDEILEHAKMVDELADIAGPISISNAQVAYFKEVLEANADVRWTFCFMHAPPYFTLQSGEKDPGNFSKIEAMMEDQPYTVFSAHTHVYNYEKRDDRDFITTSTSGGINFTRPGSMDHVIWVTMTNDGPKIVNLLMNGIMDKKGPPSGDAMEGFGLYESEE